MFALPARLLTAGLLALGSIACQGPGPLATPEPDGAAVSAPAPAPGTTTAARDPQAAPGERATGDHGGAVGGDHGAVPVAPPVDPQPDPGAGEPPDRVPATPALSSEQHLAELKPELVAERIAEHAALASDGVIAELRCGSGAFTLHLARLVPRGRVLAMDDEPQRLDALRVAMAEHGVDNVAPLATADGASSIPAATADVLFLADSYHRIDDRVAAFRDLRAALRPGGHLVLLEHKDGDLPIGPPADHKVLRRERHAELERAGFELVRSLGTHIWHDFEFWRLRRADN